MQLTSFSAASHDLALHIVSRTKTKLKNTYRKKRPLSTLIIDKHPKNKMNSVSFSSPDVKKRALLPPISPLVQTAVTHVTRPTPSSIEYSRRYKDEVQSKKCQMYDQKKQLQSPYQKAEKCVTLQYNETRSICRDTRTRTKDLGIKNKNPRTSGPNQISVNTDIANLSIVRSTCKRRLSFDHVEKPTAEVKATVMPAPTNDKECSSITINSKHTASKSTKNQSVCVGGGTVSVLKRHAADDNKDASLNSSKHATAHEIEEAAKKKREKIALKATQRAQVYI